MTRQTLSPAAALREAARQLEHGCAFNEDEMRGWSASEKALNTRLISRSRELHARADRLERGERAVATWPCGRRECVAHATGHDCREG